MVNWEGEADRLALEALYSQMTEPATYETIANADHYANVASIGPIIVYDEQVLHELVSTIDSWLSGRA